MKKAILLFRNKYFLVILFTLVWMMFFDRNDMFSQYRLRQRVKQLEADREFYLAEIARVKNEKQNLETNLDLLEKFAREKYLMKRDNEDLFVIVD